MSKLTRTKRRVISHDCLPTKAPTALLLVTYLFLERAGASEWVLGGYAVLAIVILLMYVASAFQEVQVYPPGLNPNRDD